MSHSFPPKTQPPLKETINYVSVSTVNVRQWFEAISCQELFWYPSLNTVPPVNHYSVSCLSLAAKIML